MVQRREEGGVMFIPMSALERCDLCHDLHALRKVHFNGRQFLCRKCRDQEQEKEENQEVAS